MLRKFILATAAAALAVTPVMAQAAPARVASPVAETEQLSQALIAALFVAGFALLVLILDGGDDGEDVPVSA